jgi:hypothetical protein
VSDFVIDGFGLKYAMKAALEAGAPVVWGARAIWSSGKRPELLGDRQSFVTLPDIAGDERLRRLLAFGEILNKNHCFPKAWKNIPPELSGSDSRTVILLDNEDVLIVANPNESFGYLYLCASPKPGKI